MWKAKSYEEKTNHLLSFVPLMAEVGVGGVSLGCGILVPRNMLGKT